MRIPLASSRPRPEHPLLVARQQHPNLRPQHLRRFRLRPPVFPQASSWNRLSHLVHFRSRAFCGLSGQQSRPPPQEHGSFCPDMRADVQPLTIFFASRLACALKPLPNFAAAQHRPVLGPTFESVYLAMVSFELPSDARSWPSAPPIRSDDGLRHTFGTPSASG